MIFIYLIKKRGKFDKFIFKSILIHFFIYLKKNSYKLKERYLQVYKKKFQPNFIKNIFQTLPKEKDFLLPICLEKEFHKFVPNYSNFTKKVFFFFFWISFRKRFFITKLFLKKII